jgi:hypothetical protein
MSRDKVNGSFIQNIKRMNKRELIINLKNGEQLLLRAEPTDYGYSAEITIKKIEKEITTPA